MTGPLAPVVDTLLDHAPHFNAESRQCFLRMVAPSPIPPFAHNDKQSVLRAQPRPALKSLARKGWTGHTSSMSDGLYALMGVLVGGFLNVGVAMINDWRVRRRQRRTIARLLLARLIQAANHFESGLLTGLGSPGPFSGRDDLADFWAEHEALFASQLKPSIWTTLLTGVTSVEKLSGIRSTRDDLDRKIFALHVEHVKKAENALSTLAGTGRKDADVREQISTMFTEELRRRETPAPEHQG
jgi:hypothetical protein